VHRHRLFGVTVAAPRALPAAPTDRAADIVIHEHACRRPSPEPPNPRGYAYSILDSGDVHVSWSELFDFVVSADGARIDVYADPAQNTEPVYTYLISQVISVALLQQGIESLHASAVAIDGRAIILVGDSGYGKSTLTAARLLRGAQLVTDDLLVLKEQDGAMYATPGAFRLKLAPETAAQLGLTWPGVPMADGSGKNVYVPDAAQCATADLPVGEILLLAPMAPRASREPVSLAESTRALLAATFNPLHTEPLRLARLLRNAEKTARGTRIHRLLVPRDLANINRVAELI
jgi:hypothetical protein